MEDQKFTKKADDFYIPCVGIYKIPLEKVVILDRTATGAEVCLGQIHSNQLNISMDPYELKGFNYVCS